MKFFYFIFPFIIALLAFSCNEYSEVKFSLSVKTNGIENGTVLYLDDNLKI
jgi:hypothetical protein